MVAILALTMAGGFYVLRRDLRGQLDDQFERGALSIAQTLASEQARATQVVTAGPGAQLQVLASRPMADTGALFVVITNAQGIRYTHPTPALIGTPVTYLDPEPVTSKPVPTARPWLATQPGTLGVVAAGKAPLCLNGWLIGQLSGGFPGANGANALV